jgi:hypothetical protein
MRDIRRSIATALLMAGLVFSPWVGVAAAVRSLPNLASGVLRNAAGQAAAGRVLLFHDDLRDRNQLELLTTARSGADGLYTLRLLPNRSTVAAASRNDGFVNFAVSGVTRTGVSRLHFFSARQDGRGAWVGQNEGTSAMEIRATSRPPTPDYATRVEDALRAGGHGVAGDPVDTCLYDLVQTFDAQTPVMELHTWYSDLSGTATYARSNTADTAISVGVKYSGWSTNGTTHVGNTMGAAVTETKTGPYGKVLQTSFRYDRWHFRTDNYFICASPPQPQEVVEAVRWNGTNLQVSWDDTAFDGRCLTTWSAYKNRMLPGATFARWEQRLTSYGYTLGANLGPFNINMVSTSGASTSVGYIYTAGTARRAYYICGNTDYPAFSLRIFAGT